MSHIEPTTHEAKGHLYYHPRPSQRWDGLAPYWALADLLINEFDGYHEVDTEIDGEPVTIDLAYSKSGFAPRPQDNAGERLYEFELHVDGRGERKCHFNLSPRFPDMRHYESGDEITVPFDHLDASEGLTIQFQASNYDLEDIPALLPRAVFELASEVDVGLHHEYFQAPKGGRIEEIERYVRITRDWNRKLIQKGGLFDRLAMLLSAEKGTKGKHTWDNTEEMGYHHQVRLDSSGAGKLIPNHKHGKQLKSYLPENPDNFDEEDALWNPKFGVLFRKSLHSSGSIRWENRGDLLEELDETIINSLSWAEIPSKVGDQDVDAGAGGNTVFVDDDHFDVQPRDESLPTFEDPCPQLEAEQDHLLMTVLRDMTSADTEIVETVATDGGQPAQDLADESGYSLSTIYRALQRLDGVLESENGYVRFVSQKIAEEIRGIVRSTESAVEDAADRAAQLFDIDVRQSASSAFSQWLARYGAEFDAPDDVDGRPTIRIDTLMAEIKSRSQPYLPDVLDELVDAWLQDGRGRVNIHETIIDVDLVSGESYCAPLRALR
ncbi:winged helix-turn-helix domain-containing protein [Salinibaculum salinum]|uniref:winged helix-turn-helix domain-containing protein n=1 Tax=Salinibaculum salinum TaxID=3131996 RepID=UPI0030EB6529